VVFSWQAWAAVRANVNPAALAVPIVQSFYQNLTFNAAVIPGTRGLRLISAMTPDYRSKILDNVLDHAALSGWAHMELPAAPVLTADPQMVDVICAPIDNVSSSKDRETEKDHLYIHTRIDGGVITVGDVVVFIADHETPLVALDNLNASLEIKREVEACSSGDRYLLVEVKKASAASAKRLDSLVTAKSELQTNW